MSQNNLKELNDILFDQLRRLNSVSPENLDTEIDRAEAITNVAKPVLAGATLVLEAQKLKAQYQGALDKLPNMLEVKDGNNE